jgi:hypothetical protein
MRINKRKNQRRAVRREIFIYVPIECALADISVTGARLLVAKPFDVPATFIIEIKPGLYRWCREVWRHDNEIGVEFVSRPETIFTQGAKFSISTPS